jgi:cystathionine beta-lyase
MEHSFDEEYDRRGTHSVKWEFVMGEEDLLQLEHTVRFFGPDRVLPMWVADMDFRCPEPIVEALIARAEHGIYGYSAPTSAFYQSVVNWMERRHGWKIDPQWICLTPGVVPALNMSVRTFTTQGNKVLIQPPVYHPFYGAIENNHSQVITNALVLENGRYRMDFGDLETKCKDPEVKMAILCSPHNPVGRVWTRDELVEFGRICIENNVLIVSDEIHGDLIYHDHVFTPLAKISDAFAQNSVICTAPSKTFNMAGLQTSCIIIPNHDLREQFQKTLQSDGLFGVNAFGAVALQTAYDHGEGWLQDVLEYIEGNLDYFEAYVDENIPQLNVIRPEGTYLVWLDCRRLELGMTELQQLMSEKARLYLDDGFIFGSEGEGFVRINIACPRKVLVEAVDRIREAVQGLPRSN